MIIKPFSYPYSGEWFTRDEVSEYLPQDEYPEVYESLKDHYVSKVKVCDFHKNVVATVLDFPSLLEAKKYICKKAGVPFSEEVEIVAIYSNDFDTTIYKGRTTHERVQRHPHELENVDYENVFVYILVDEDWERVF